MMINKKTILIILSAIIVIGIIVMAFYVSKPKQVTPSIPDTKTSREVIISTDKNEYDKGEIINIVVDNGLSIPILYYSGVERFWGLEYFKNNEWMYPNYGSGADFQLTEKNVGDNCYILLYERTYPPELKSQSNISGQWNQKICPYGTGSPAEPRTVKYIEGGKYRLIFNYGFEISDGDPFELSDINTVYSNTFTIK